MHRRLWAVALACLACKTKAGPEVTPPDVAAADLRQFLDGMLVTSKAAVSHEPIWPETPETRVLPWVMYAMEHGYGVKTPEQLRKQLDVPIDELGRREAWMLEWLKDFPTLKRFWKRMLEKDPNDLEAAMRLAQIEADLNGAKAALDAIANVSGRTAKNRSPMRSYSPGVLESLRCTFLLRVHRAEEAERACELAIELDERSGQLPLTMVLLALGKNKEALAQAEAVAKLPGRMANMTALFTLGLAQQYNGRDNEALVTWNVARARWPSDTVLAKAISGRKRSIFQWMEEEADLRRPWAADQLALCGHYYAELGMEDRSKECYRQSNRVAPGPALAHQLVYKGATDAAGALTEALAAVKTNPNSDLMTAVAWLSYRLGKLQEAQSWAQRVLELDPYNAKATSLIWQLCGDLKDYVCLIEYRKRLGLPTHFNQEQYRDADKAWKEQAERNGLGLAAREPDSTDSRKPPPIRSVTIVPLGERTPPELDGISGFLSADFPGLRISVAPPMALPNGVYSYERRQAMWEDFLERLPNDPGRLYVLEQDLASYDLGFAYARHDLQAGRAVVSVSRLRNLVGKPTPSDTTLEGMVLEAAKQRLHSQVVNSIAKLLGASFPCSWSTCALHERRSVTDLTLAKPAFCEKHKSELNELIARGERAGP